MAGIGAGSGPKNCAIGSSQSMGLVHRCGGCMRSRSYVWRWRLPKKLGLQRQNPRMATSHLQDPISLLQNDRSRKWQTALQRLQSILASRHLTLGADADNGHEGPDCGSVNTSDLVAQIAFRATLNGRLAVAPIYILIANVRNGVVSGMAAFLSPWVVPVIRLEQRHCLDRA